MQSTHIPDREPLSDVLCTEIVRDRVGGSKWSYDFFHSERVECVPDMSRTPGIVTNRRDHRELIENGDPARGALIALRPQPAYGSYGKAADGQAPCASISSARNKSYMCEHLQNELYASGGTAGALEGGGSGMLISRDLEWYGHMSH